MSTIKSLKAHNKINLPLLLDACTSGNTKDGNLFLTLKFKDTTGEIDGKIWSVSPELLQETKDLVGKIVTVDAQVIEFKSALQLKINTIQCAPVQEVEKFVNTAPLPLEQMLETLESYVFKINDSDLQRVCRKLLQDHRVLFQTSPAASRNHHDYLGGLLHHVTSMLQLAEAIKNLYPVINESLLYSGIIIHDIGKVVELSGPIGTQYTLEGKLLGHISIALKMLSRTQDELRISNSESILLLEHLLLSHHGKLEFGSPKEPVVLEAEVLNFIDNLDARMVMMERALKATAPGEFTPRVFSLENRSFYRPLKSNIKDDLGE